MSRVFNLIISPVYAGESCHPNENNCLSIYKISYPDMNEQFLKTVVIEPDGYYHLELDHDPNEVFFYRIVGKFKGKFREGVMPVSSSQRFRASKNINGIGTFRSLIAEHLMKNFSLLEAPSAQVKEAIESVSNTHFDFSNFATVEVLDTERFEQNMPAVLSQLVHSLPASLKSAVTDELMNDLSDISRLLEEAAASYLYNLSHRNIGNLSVAQMEKSINLAAKVLDEEAEVVAAITLQKNPSLKAAVAQSKNEFFSRTKSVSASQIYASRSSLDNVYRTAGRLALENDQSKTISLSLAVFSSLTQSIVSAAVRTTTDISNTPDENEDEIMNLAQSSQQLIVDIIGSKESLEEVTDTDIKGLAAHFPIPANSLLGLTLSNTDNSDGADSKKNEKDSKEVSDDTKKGSDDRKENRNESKEGSDDPKIGSDDVRGK